MERDRDDAGFVGCGWQREFVEEPAQRLLGGGEEHPAGGWRGTLIHVHVHCPSLEEVRGKDEGHRQQILAGIRPSVTAGGDSRGWSSLLLKKKRCSVGARLLWCCGLLLLLGRFFDMSDGPRMGPRRVPPRQSAVEVSWFVLYAWRLGKREARSGWENKAGSFSRAITTVLRK